jgi:hypothetical protein
MLLRVKATAVVASTQKWFHRIVIGEKLCPFAPPLLAANTLRIVASEAFNVRQAVADIKSEVHLLLSVHTTTHCDFDVNSTKSNGTDSKDTKPSQPHHETTLVVFDAPFVKDFRDFVRLSWTLQEEVLVEGCFHNDLQLVLFHPEATHQTYKGEGDETAAAADYTIRSPYPVVHLLREADVMQAVQGGYRNLEDLPERNKHKLSAQGIFVCQSRLDECYILDNDVKPQ